MTTATRALLDEALSEEEWMAQIVELAKSTGWKIYHTHDSRRSPAGFPDLVLLRPPELIFLETKTEKGRVTPEQLTWVQQLKAVTKVYADIARPRHWPDVEQALRSKAR